MLGMSSLLTGYPLMNANKAQKQSAIVSSNAGDQHLEVVKDDIIPLAKAKPRAAYALGTNEPWPDQGLNRILSIVENFNIGDIDEIECLEMLFYLSSKRGDVRQLAEAAIQTYGSLGKVFERPGKELRELLGFDHSMTALLAVAKTSMQFILANELPARQEVSSYTALLNYLALDLRHAEQETLRVLYLDNKCKIIKDEEMARGTVNAVSLYPTEIAKRAVAHGASFIVLAHNHLGDDPKPSRDDIEATQQTKRALQIFDIVLHDHVIIARNSCFSMNEQKLI